MFYVVYFTGSLRFLKLLGNITKEAGESVKLKCEVTGDPPPTKIRWFKNEAPVIEEKGRLVARRYNPQVQPRVIMHWVLVALVVM
jgi:receptor tyrosine kinase-like orphan receptor 1